uniref:Ribosome biogenesis protein slx9-like n=1 Tax=Kalanchoe fedtschenkoi TaxID=63787 RepID=A0A7N0ZQY4_KALFE
MGLASLRSDSGSKKKRKSEKKVQFSTKVKETVAGLAAKKVIGKKRKLRSRQKKLKAYDLSALTESLPDVNSAKRADPTDLKLNSKRRQQLVLKEGSQLKGVLNHPVFQADPLGSLYQHLASTQPAVEETAKKPSKDKKRKKSKAKKAKKSVHVPRAMDI